MEKSGVIGEHSGVAGIMTGDLWKGHDSDDRYSSLILGPFSVALKKDNRRFLDRVCIQNICQKHRPRTFFSPL